MRGRALLAVVALAGLAVSGQAHAQAQDSGAAICRGFCDTDAKQCRAEAKDLAGNEVSPLDPNDFNIHAHPQVPNDDFSSEKQHAVEHAADQDRFSASQKCTATRMACVQRCAAPAAAPAASAP